MLSESTAHLVEQKGAVLGEHELVHIKGADKRVSARRLLGMGNGLVLARVLSRVLSVGGGRCPPLKGCGTVRSTATALWSPW